MTMTIGRAGLDVTLEDPESLSIRGDLVSMANMGQPASSVADLLALRQQLLACQTDEGFPVVPVTWSEDSHLNGYYRVRGVECTASPLILAGGPLQWRVDLERVDQYAQPLFEVISQGNRRSTDFSGTYTTGRDFTVMPAASGSGSFKATGVTSSDWSVTAGGRTAEEGSLDHYLTDVTSRNNAVCWGIDPAKFYWGAPRLELSYDAGATFRTAPGRQIRNLFGAGLWRLSNGIMRVSFSGTTNLDMTIQCWDGSQWDTGVSFRFSYGTTTTYLPRALTVLEASAFAHRVRLSLNNTNGTTVLDVGLRRGAHHIEFRQVCQAGSGGFTSFKCANTTTSAATTGTGRIIQTTAANGNKWLIMTPVTKTDDTTNGAITTNNGTQETAHWGVGFEINTATAATINQANQLYQEMLSAHTHTIRYVGR